MKPFIALVLSFFLSLSAYCQTNTESHAENRRSSCRYGGPETLRGFECKQKVEYYKHPQTGKHYIRVWYKNVGTAAVQNLPASVHRKWWSD